MVLDLVAGALLHTENWETPAVKLKYMQLPVQSYSSQMDTLSWMRRWKTPTVWVFHRRSLTFCNSYNIKLTRHR